MPPTLHPHLKRGLDFDDFHVNPKDVIEEIPAHYYDLQERAAKRRRVEIIAAQYLRGTTPVILSAGLRGPFNNGWKNVWMKNIRVTPKSPGQDHGMIARRNRPSRRNASEGTSTANASKGRKKGLDKAQEKPQMASPEASRAAKDDLSLEANQRDDSLDEVEIPPATAPSQTEEDASDTTEYLSANTGKCIRKRSPLTNPFWLRRPEAQEIVDMNKRSNNNTEVSPTRSRSRNGHSQLGVAERLQLTVPEVPLHGQVSPARHAVSKECKPGASAAMIISSPAKGANAMPNTEGHRLSLIGNRVQLEQTPEKSATKQERFLHSHLTHLDTPSEEAGHDNVRELANIGHRTTPSRSLHRPPEEDIRKSTERLVNLMPSSNRRQEHSRRKDVQKRATRNAPQHDLVASPAPASSTGFVYRKVGNSKRNREGAQMSKAKIINSNSSPATQNGAINSEEQGLKRLSDSPKLESDIMNVHPRDIAKSEGGSTLRSEKEQVEADGDELHEERELRSSRSRRASTFSTQAAMLLAQKVFLEGAFPTMSSDTPRHPQHDTPRSLSTGPNPAITPLSVFNAHLEKSLPDASVLRGPPVSTQDLFGAASPFAFSTIKKRPEIPQRSSLRFAQLQTDDEQPETDATPAKSPTPSAERIPLKAKNTTTAFWSFVTQKASQASQESLVDRTRHSVGEVELPQLDFHTSLDDFGPNGDLHFTDRFLRNLDDL
ncbi:Nn.00g019780.m01.CDS01 [Neocucurbitaria sp. VM-36]